MKLKSRNGLFNFSGTLLASYKVKDDKPSSYYKALCSSKSFNELFYEQGKRFKSQIVLGKKSKKKKRQSYIPIDSICYSNKNIAVDYVNSGFPAIAIGLGSAEYIKNLRGEYFLFQIDKLPGGIVFGGNSYIWMSAPRVSSINTKKKKFLIEINETAIDLNSGSRDSNSITINLKGKKVRYKVSSKYMKTVRKSLKVKNRGKCYLFVDKENGNKSGFGGLIWENEFC